MKKSSWGRLRLICFCFILIGCVSSILSPTVSAEVNWWRYSVEDGQKTQITNFGNTDEIFSYLLGAARMSPDGKSLTMGGRRVICTYDLHNRIFKKIYKDTDDVVMVPIVWTEHGILVAKGAYQKYFNHIKTWDLLLVNPTDGSVIQTWPKMLDIKLDSLLWNVMPSPQRDVLLIGGENMFDEADIYLFDMKTDKRKILEGYSPSELFWSPDGKSFVAYRHSSEGVYQPVQVNRDGVVERELAFRGNYVPTEWSADGKYLIAYIYGLSTGNHLGFISTDTWEPVTILDNLGIFNMAVLSPDSRYVAYSLENPFEKRRILNLATPNGEVTSIEEQPSCVGLIWSPDGKYLYHASAK